VGLTPIYIIVYLCCGGFSPQPKTGVPGGQSLTFGAKMCKKWPKNVQKNVQNDLFSGGGGGGILGGFWGTPLSFDHQTPKKGSKSEGWGFAATKKWGFECCRFVFGGFLTIFDPFLTPNLDPPFDPPFLTPF